MSLHSQTLQKEHPQITDYTATHHTTFPHFLAETAYSTVADKKNSSVADVGTDSY